MVDFEKCKDPMFCYKATIIDVYDGDTVTADVDLGFCTILGRQKIRLVGIQAPEKRGGTTKTKKLAKISTDFVKEKVLDKQVKIWVNKDRTKGKYGRYLCIIEYPDPENDGKYINLNQQMLDLDLAEEY